MLGCLAQIDLQKKKKRKIIPNSDFKEVEKISKISFTTSVSTFMKQIDKVSMQVCAQRRFHQIFVPIGNHLKLMEHFILLTNTSF